MKYSIHLFASIVCTLLLPPRVMAGPCDAYFPFDGNVADSGANGYDGQVIMKGRGPAVRGAQFAPGKNGQALQLTGQTAVRAPMDLNPEVCRQMTITAWVKFDDSPANGFQYLVTSGEGGGPRLVREGRHLDAYGGAVRLKQSRALRAGEWHFVATTWDYDNRTMTLYWHNRSQQISMVKGAAGAAGPGIWIGAREDDLRQPVVAGLIDDLRIYGRILNEEKIRSLKTGSIAAPGGNANLPQSITPIIAPRTPMDIPGDARLDGSTGISADENSGYSPPLLNAPDGHDPYMANQELTPPDDLPANQLQRDVDLLPDTPQISDDEAPASLDLEVYRHDAEGPIRTIDIVLPGTSELETITYQDVDGVAVTEGDIVLGNVSELNQWAAAVADEVARSGNLQTRRQGLNAKKNTKYLWPGGIIPYEYHSNVSNQTRQLIEGAASKLSSNTNLNLIRRTDQKTYVQFKMKDKEIDACSSRVGMRQTSGSQTIKVDPNCRETSLMHEILHAAGFFHEQSRADRDQYVDVLMDNVISGKKHNFSKKSSNKAIGIGPYNYKSIMHYGEFTFGKDCLAVGTDDLHPDCIGGKSRTIRAKNPATRIKRDFTTDISDINKLYPAKVSSANGRNWGNSHYGTAVAIGDIDGDGYGEIIVGRFANDHSRFVVLDDARMDHEILVTGPSNWGDGVSVTDIAVGDVDGDGIMEIGITRRANSSHRFYVYKVRNGRLIELFSGGDDWGTGIYATAIAFGDVDGDGRDEIAVGRKAGQYGRYYLYDDASATQPYKRLAIGGSVWGSDSYTTALAFGDVDGDGRDELGIARKAPSGFRYEIVSYSGNLTQKHAGGNDWDSQYYATAIAFGNVDDDGSDEILIGRAASTNSRFYLLDDAAQQFSLIDKGGDLWGADYHVVGVDLADVDKDGRDEILVARNAGEHGRYYVFDDRLAAFEPIPIRGDDPVGGVGATDIAAGDVDNNGKADIVVTFDEKVNGRPRFEVLHMN